MTYTNSKQLKSRNPIARSVRGMTNRIVPDKRKEELDAIHEDEIVNSITLPDGESW